MPICMAGSHDKFGNYAWSCDEVKEGTHPLWSNHSINLRDDIIPNSIWLDKVLDLTSRYKRNPKNLFENLFSTNLIKLYSSQNIIIATL